MTRPELLVGVCGTATEVGKTHVAAAVARHLRDAGVRVGARKPLQSFDVDDRGPTDAEVLARATGEHPHEVCPPEGWYPVPMAPPMAADALGRRCPTLEEVVDGIRWPEERLDVGLVETVGGVRSPLADDGHSGDLVKAIAADRVLLVADAGLGTIDAVRHAVHALAALPVVFLNRFDADDDLHQRNRRWLADRDGIRTAVDVDEAVQLLR